MRKQTMVFKTMNEYIDDREKDAKRRRYCPHCEEGTPVYRIGRSKKFECDTCGQTFDENKVLVK